MARGPKKHLKRINTPRSWLLSKMGGIFTVRPSQGPHKLRDCHPLSIIIRYIGFYSEKNLILLSLAAKSPWLLWIKKQDSKSTTRSEEMLNSQLVSWMSYQSLKPINIIECSMMLRADSL